MTTYADRPWTKHYDDHVPASLEPYPTKVVHDYLRQAAKSHPDRIAFTTTAKIPVVGRQDTHLTYRELDSKSDALAAALIELGLKKGDRVAIVMPNTTSFGIAYWAILKAGGVVAATNPTYPAKRMAYQINDCDAEIIICLSMFYDMIKSIQHETKAKTVIVSNIKEYFPSPAKFLFTIAREKKDGHRIDLKAGDVWFQDLLAKYEGRTVDVDVTQDDIAVFQYTGGTTGVSKGAMGTHRALVVNCHQLRYWTGSAVGLWDNHQPLSYLGAIPMFHIYGLLVMLTQCAVDAGQIFLIPNPRDMDEVVDCIDYYKPNVMLGVPALYNAINNHPRVQSGEVSLKNFIVNSSGSAPLPTKTKEEYDARVNTGITEGYGMSETFTAVTSNPLFGEQKIRSVGLPYPDTDMKIVAIDDPDVIMPIGDVGELVVSAPNLMKGYHGMPTETKNTLREDASGKTWIYTGDIAKMDDQGYFYIVDRKKDMALIGGYNVYPATIEVALKDHPAVFEVGVAAIPHPEKHGQEALKAWIVLQPDMTATADDLMKHCEAYLAQYEIPRRISFVSELPKSAVGKTLRRELIRMEMEEADKKARETV
ncbi:MAG: AMP-binding protein [Phototrophicaceae bacterium]